MPVRTEEATNDLKTLYDYPRMYCAATWEAHGGVTAQLLACLKPPFELRSRCFVGSQASKFASKHPPGHSTGSAWCGVVGLNTVLGNTPFFGDRHQFFRRWHCRRSQLSCLRIEDCLVCPTPSSAFSSRRSFHHVARNRTMGYLDGTSFHDLQCEYTRNGGGGIARSREEK